MTLPDTAGARSSPAAGGARFSTILLDLDGTITDSAPGIGRALVATFEELGMPVPRDLRAWVGPPILDSFRDLAGLDEVGAREALIVYRRFYRETGAAEAPAFPGVLELIGRIRAAGVPLSLATSKPESQARAILERLGVAANFTVICGASEDEVRSAKADVVEEALRRLAEADADLTSPVMVGDRGYDVAGAAAHGIPTILVGWGYAEPGEERGTLAVAADAADLARLLGV